jgi:hypothetical protein
MKQITLLLMLIAFTISVRAQSATGAWELTSGQDKVVIAVTDNYLSYAEYRTVPASFYRTWGGTYEMKDNNLVVNVEFDSKDSAKVGEQTTLKLQVITSSLVVVDGKYFNRIDNGGTSALFGGWQITQRVTPMGDMQRMKRGARKTLKVLTGTRFQWIAMNTETGEFSGTGGGTYTLKDGVYTEQIEFFSRDNDRVGASLSFDAEVNNIDWVHSGKSSKGQPIKEVWSKIE